MPHAVSTNRFQMNGRGAKGEDISRRAARNCIRMHLRRECKVCANARVPVSAVRGYLFPHGCNISTA